MSVNLKEYREIKVSPTDANTLCESCVSNERQLHDIGIKSFPGNNHTYLCSECLINLIRALEDYLKSPNLKL